MEIKAKNLAAIFKAIGSTSFAKKNTEDVEELNTVRIVAVNGNMQIISTNSKISTACLIPSFKEEFSITADNNNMASCIEAAADKSGNIEFFVQNGVLMMKGKMEVAVPTGQEKQGKFVGVKKEPIASVLAEDVIRAIEGVLIAVDKSTEVLKHVQFSFNPEETQFNMTAFNGTMMARANIPLEDINHDEEKTEVLVSGEILKAILPLLKIISSQIVDISVDGTRVMISSENMKIVFECMSENFVQCEKLLEHDFASYVVFNTIALKKQLNDISKVVKEDVQFVSDGTTSEFKSGYFKMSAQPERVNEVAFTLPISVLTNIIGKIKGETVRIAVDNKILIKIMREDSEDIIFITGGTKSQ